MPRRNVPVRQWNHPQALADLVADSTTAALTVGSVRVGVAAVPLFREQSGSLQQAIRLHLDGLGEGLGARLSVLAGETVLDQLTVGVEANGTSVHLFVPEVTSETTFRLVVAVGNDTTDADIVIGPQRKWSVHFVHHSHFDLGYTDPQGVVMENQLRYLDAALDLITLTDDWDDNAAFRWNVEVHYPLQHWMAARPKPMRDEFVRRVKEGRIEVNALPFSMHSEVYSIDELAWGLKYTDRLREEHGLEIVSAIQSDVPGATIGLLNLLTAADVRYFSVAHNYAGRSVPFRVGGQDLTRPFWWQGADGKRLLVWQSDTPHGLAYMDGVFVGIPQSEATARGLLPDYLASLATRPYPYGRHVAGWHGMPTDVEVTKQLFRHSILCMRIQNGFADNAPPSLTIAETIRDWNERWAYPRLRLSTNRDFFTVAEKELGDTLDTFSGDWTDWWVDGVGSAALPLGFNRHTQGRVRTAQTLHTLAETLTRDKAPTIEAEIERVYEDAALFDEHTWGSGNPWEDKLDHFDSGQLQWGTKSAFAYQAYDRSATLVNSGLHHLGAAFTAAPNVLASLLVFNPSGWTRTDIARVFVSAERVVPGTPFSVIDASTGREVLHTIELQPNPGFRAKGQWVIFAARDLPPVGYARFDLVSGGSAPTATATDDLTLESQFYRVTVDRRDGFITSIVDRDTGRELVDGDAPYGFNEYIYDRYTTAPGFNHLSSRVEDIDLRLLGSRSTATQASVVARTSDPIAERLTVRLFAEGARWLETTITLPHDVKRVDLANRLLKNATMDKESVYYAFPFAVDDAGPEYEITGGVTSLDRPHVPGSCQHMFAIRHWLAMQDDKGSAAWATMEAPLIELGTISLPYAPFPYTLPGNDIKRSTVYSWALNNIWDTNFPPEQGGEMWFRYAVSSDTNLSRRELGIRTGASFAAPLVGICLRAGTGDQATTGSFVSVSHPLVELVTIASARQSDGITIFLHSLADETVETNLTFSLLHPTRVQIGNHLERHLEDVALSGETATVTLTPGAYVAVVIS